MKALFVSMIVGFALQAQATIGYDVQPYPIVQCKNQMVYAQLMVMPNQKDVQLVVNDLRLDTRPNIVYAALVHPADGGTMQMYLNAQASLRVMADGKALKGYLNLNRTRASVEQVLECRAFFRIQPEPRLRPVL